MWNDSVAETNGRPPAASRLRHTLWNWGLDLVIHSTETPIRVLLIEDNPGDARLIRELLVEASDDDFVLETVERLAEGLDRLSEGAYGAVLLDLHLPDAVRLDALAQVQSRAPDVPIVVLTGLDDDAVGVAAVQQGAQDYLTKGGLTPQVLTRSLHYAIRRHRTIQHLRTVSTIDELTGLNNRRGFLALAKQQLKLAERAGQTLLMFFADLDGLKRINDTWGHDEGDHALMDAADLMAETFRDSDVVGRIGGDEFVVLMMGCPLDEAEALVARLQQNLERLHEKKGRRFRLSISVGVAVYDPVHPCSIEELLRRADAAMYEKKRLRRVGRPVPA